MKESNPLLPVDLLFSVTAEGQSWRYYSSSFPIAGVDYELLFDWHELEWAPPISVDYWMNQHPIDDNVVIDSLYFEEKTKIVALHFATASAEQFEKSLQ